MVINTDEVLTKDYDEMDVYQLKDFLEAVIHEKNEYYCACARISDLFGFDLKMRNTFRTYINTLDEDDWKLHISDDFTELEISVTDDSINEFYVKDNWDRLEKLCRMFADRRYIFRGTNRECLEMFGAI